MTTTMRILHITRLPITVTAFLIPIIKEQRKCGDYVAVSCCKGSEVRIINSNGFDCFIHRLEQSLKPLNLLRAFFDIRKIIKDNKFDAVVCHTPLISAISRIAAWTTRTKKIVYFAHGLPCVPMQNRLKWLIVFLVEWLLGRITDGMLVMNSYDETLVRNAHLIRNSKKIFRISGIGVDTNKYCPSTDFSERKDVLEELNASWANKIVISTGRIIKAKGSYEYVASALKILTKNKDVLFLLAGSGPELDNLKDLVACAGQQAKMQILGWRRDIAKLTRIADIFVLPTYYFEGLPVSILEAMACGKPVIATKHRGCEDAVLDGQTGYLVEPKSAEDLVSKLEILLENDRLAEEMGKRGRIRVEQKFELNYCTNQIVEALEKIIC